jgi:hypothetical protein
MEARAGGAGHWRRWNGAQWKRPGSAKSGPSAADVSVERGCLRLIGGRGIAGPRCRVALASLRRAAGNGQWGKVPGSGEISWAMGAC